MRNIIVDNGKHKHYYSAATMSLTRALELLEGELAQQIADELADIELEISEGKDILARAKRLGIKPSKR